MPQAHPHSKPRSTEYRLLTAIAMLYIAMLIFSNTIAVKLVTFFGLVLPAGIITFPLVYLINDLLTEVYGFERTRPIIWWGFICLAIMALVYTIAVWMPYPPFWQDQESFQKLFSLVPRIVFASLIAYLIGTMLNAIVLSKLKVMTQGRFLWLRAIGSTVIGEGADSLVFNLVAFYGVFETSQVFYIALSGFILKTLYEVVALPLTYAAVRLIKRIEDEDKYDVGVSYSPFGRRGTS
jgi:queuosine precursor transporter